MRRRSSKSHLNKLDKPAQISFCMDAVLEKIGGKDKFGAAKVFVHWPAIVGAVISSNTKPVKFENGLLYVNVRDSAWLMELRSVSKYDILRAVRSQMGTVKIEDIIFRLGPID
ncbi:MAG: DUF721 domain-containing protein [Candidatus Auribacterota bacterium]|nr:DUF721 domain-containing protein [Candidatus Auribacterota bacterium]